MFAKSAYFTVLHALPAASAQGPVAQRVFDQVFRGDFTAPGAALLDLGRAVSSEELRRFMVELKGALSALYHGVFGKHLVYLSMARFNQQATTKFHLDGSPDEAYLMLGYEPTAVTSTIAIADYTRAALDWGIEPKTLLSDCNPMYADHERRLLPYVTRLEGLDPGASCVLLLNNSSLPYREDSSTTLGVMHQATIMNPRPDQNRVVNSTMIGVSVERPDETLGLDIQQTFVATQEVAGAVGVGMAR